MDAPLPAPDLGDGPSADPPASPAAPASPAPHASPAPPADRLPRPLTGLEADVAWTTLEAAAAGHLVALRHQLADATVVAECRCPCPSVTLQVGPASAAVPGVPQRLVVSSEAPEGTVEVWLEHGFLSELKLSWTTPQPPTRFPQPWTLTPERPVRLVAVPLDEPVPAAGSLRTRLGAALRGRRRG